MEIREICRGDRDYPQRLADLRGMPEKIYASGPLPDDGTPSAAIVGARMCSGYGRDTAYELGRFLAGNGVSVISGMASGIDGSAHLGALDAGGYTCAVLAGGIDVCYPKSNIEIYERIRQTGGLLSEHGPGSESLSYYFPIRNRIISALADIVIIVEAKRRSGSLITADFALEQGKIVLAVPGRICDALSEGCNKLISQGAGIICSPETVLSELESLAWKYREAGPGRADISGKRAVKKEKTPLPNLSEEAKAAIKLLPDKDILTADMVSSALAVPEHVAAGILMELFLADMLEELGRGKFRRRIIS